MKFNAAFDAPYTVKPTLFSIPCVRLPPLDEMGMNLATVLALRRGESVWKSTSTPTALT